MVAYKKRLIIGISLLFAGSAMAVSSCSCENSNSEILKCQQSAAQGLTWWNWLTNNKSSQLHFFQLIELLHIHDREIQNDTAAIIKEKQKPSNI